MWGYVDGIQYEENVASFPATNYEMSSKKYHNIDHRSHRIQLSNVGCDGKLS